MNGRHMFIERVEHVYCILYIFVHYILYLDILDQERNCTLHTYTQEQYRYACIHPCMHVPTKIQTYIQPHKHTNMHAKSQPDVHTGKHTDNIFNTHIL